MPDDILDALRAVTGRLVVLAEGDPELRANLKQLARAVLESLPETVTELDSVAPSVERRPPASEEPDEEYIPAAIAAKALWPSDAPASTAAVEQPRPDRWNPPDDSDLVLNESRCRLKAEGARWAASRRRQLNEGADFRYDIAPLDRDLIDRAKQIDNCYLWMNSPHAPVPENLELLDDIAACFETMADAASLVRTTIEMLDSHPEFFEDSLDLLAEAQSSLRVAVQRIDGPSDHDQQQIFNWLRYTTNVNHVRIERYMRIDDPADPGRSNDLSARIEALDDRIQRVRNQEKNRRKLFSKLRYEAKRFREGGNGAESHLNTIIGTVDGLVSDGIPPSNSQIRELLLPIVDELPEMLDASANVKLVFREIDRYLANLAPDDSTKASVEPTEEVRKVAELLSGKAAFLIGGTRRPHSHDALRKAFGLSEVIWFDTKEHESNEKFKPHVAREDVAVVLLAIRWSSHSYGDLKEFCDQYGKPLVRLPAGYNPNQVAMQIWDQAGERLQETKV